MTGKPIRVGNAGGYWGDDLGALSQQLRPGSLDYITQDYLAEITMSILQKQRSRNPELGFAQDFLDQMQENLGHFSTARTRLISNAGGINPTGCARALESQARQAGFEIQIGVVEGDDLMDRLDDLIADGHEFRNLETDEPLSTIRDRIQSANVYLGAAPVVEALRLGAQVVITGRVTDTGIALAPPVFEFGWDFEDWNRLAAGVVAGHILECGAQSTGGNFTDWEEIPSFLGIGYPIAEFSRDGSFIVTKHPGSGGLVNRKTVTAQLVYELGNPTQYISPDVVVDFSQIDLVETGDNRVLVKGVEGTPRPSTLKVSVSYLDGFKSHGTMIVSRPRAVAKCRKMAEIFWKRLGLAFEETSTELIGHDACHRHLAPESDPPEILLRLGVRDADREKVLAFSKLFTSLILNTVPGVAIVGSRPKVQEVVAYWPCLISAREITTEVSLLQSQEFVTVPWQPPSPEPIATQEPNRVENNSSHQASQDSTLVELGTICFARSGDKGDTCNIGVVGRSGLSYLWMREQLTASLVKEYFEGICLGQVERFELPKLWALNFLLHASLGGGGTVSLRVDPQGKTLADALLRMEVRVPVDILASVE